MALSGSVAVKATGQNNLIFSWGAVQDVAANASQVSWQLLLEAGQFGRIDATPGSPWKVTVAGTEFSGTTSLAIGNYETKVLASGQVTVAHEADGTGQFAFSFSQEFWIQFDSDYITVVSGSGSGVLDTIARSSMPTLSATGLVMGDTVTICTNRAASSLTHTLEYRFGTLSGVIARGVGDFCPWTPDPALAWQIPDAVSGTAVITCTTYAGDTPIGTREVTAVLTVPEDVVPTVSARWEDVSGAQGRVGTLVQGISRLETAVSGTGSCGSTIIGAEVTLNGKPYGGGIITAAGALPLVVSVTDSRGRVGCGEYTLSVAAYTLPGLTLSASRCREDGTPDDTGDYARITVSGQVTPVGSNEAALELSWGGSTETVSGTGLEKTVYADPDATMSITAVLRDKLASASRTMVLSTGYATLDLLAGGKGISFGKAATREGFDCAMKAYFRNGLYEIRSDGSIDSRSLFDRVAELETKLR